MEDNNSKQPLLSSIDEEQVPQLSGQRYFIQHLSNHSFTSSFVADGDDIAPITGLDGFIKAFNVESKKLWYLAGPAIFTSVCQYSLGAITQTFAGHIGTHSNSPLSPSRTQSSPWGMGSALETLCGQAFGAGKIDMLGVYMQRSWVILLATSFLLTLIYVFACGTDFTCIGARQGHFSSRSAIFPVDDSTALRLCDEFSDRQVFPGAEQNYGDGLDFCRRVGFARLFQLAVYVEARVGNGWWRLRDMVSYSTCSLSRISKERTSCCGCIIHMDGGTEVGDECLGR
ncbi:hypothetical protein DH2020_003635 [Rehmannia glutinosa]|uniref:Uncharacterized protein n=1 Tax=Rehmannia glutinosa TaxID=99300 RepID=A0ABR0XMC8_REHGL